MRVLIYIYCFPGVRGTEKVTSFLANELVKNGNDVTVLSHISMAVHNESFPLCNEVRVIHTPEKSYYSHRNKRFIGETVREINPDVIIFQDSTAPIAHNVFSSRVRCPVVVCAHTVAYKHYEVPNNENGFWRYVIESLCFPVIRQIKYLRDRMRRRGLYDKCWRYVLLSTRLFGEFRAVARIGDSRKLRAIPNPVLDYSPDCADCSNTKADEIVFVGALNRGKGVDLLLRAWSKVKENSWQLKIVGDGPARVSLEDAAKQMGLRNVEFVGWDSDSAKYFKRARVLAFPSRGEGWGLVVSEAMAEGCVPIIMDSYSSAREIVDDEINGAVVPAFDVTAFAERLTELMSDAEKLERLSRNAREKAKCYKPATVFRAWERLLSELPQDYSRQSI